MSYLSESAEACLAIVERGARRMHSTQKPVALFGWCLELEAPVKSVIDPFAGSGTTAIACKERGIPCTLIEMDAHYCEVIVHRLGQLFLPMAMNA